MTKTALDPVTAYATDVVKGRIVAGRKVRLACERHLKDLKRQKARGLVWKPAEAQLAIDFFPEVLCLPEETDAGEVLDVDAEPTDGTPFRLTPWQQFVVGSLMGWYTVGGYRRFRTGYIETAKGQGKTPLCAGIILYIFVADGERGAQLFFAAVSKEQAQIAFADAEKMAKASPVLRDLIDFKVNNLSILETGSFVRAISAEKRGLDGKRVSAAVIDELHEAPTAVVVNKMRKGTKGRRNALILEPTNSGHDRTSVCWRHHEYSTKVLEETVVDDAWFAFVCGLDPCDACLAAGKEFPQDDCKACDSWRVEGPHWLKASPNLGVSLSWQYVRELVRLAIGMPSEVSDLLRFNFCVWTQAHSRFLDIARWGACAPRPADEVLALAPCYAAIDLGQSDDLCAFVRIWLLDAGVIAVKARFWLPESALEQFPDRPYEEWRRAGDLEVTEGNITDYTVVQDAIEADCKAAGVIQCAFDKRFANQMAQNLEGAGITMIDMPQGFQLNEGLRKLRDTVATEKLAHGSNPILSYMAGNAVVRHGRNKEMRLDKEKAADKIDGISALTMALQLVVVKEPVRESIYETREMTIL